MKLTILGSGTGVPSLRRGSPGALVQTDGTSILLDSGSGTLRRMLEVGVTYKDLDVILYSHIHPDHISELVPFLFACKYHEDPRQKDLLVVGGKGFGEYLSNLRGVYGAWVVPDTFVMEVKEVRADALEVETVRIRTLPVKHAAESVGYRLETQSGQTLVYSGDTDYCRNIVALAKGADVLLLEASFPETLKTNGHLTPSLAGRIAEEAGCKKLMLTHFYPPCDQTDIRRSCQKFFSGEVIVAEDMMVIEF